MQDMRDFMECHSALMGPGAHGHMFYSTTEFKIWYEVLFGEGEEQVKQKEILESKEPANRMTNVLEVEAKAGHYVWAPGMYIIDPLVNPLQHLSVADHSVPFWRERLPAPVMLRCVDHMRLQKNVSDHPCFTSVGMSVPRLTVDEAVNADELSENCQR